MDETAKEIATATGEVAKTAGKGIDVISKFGAFFAGPLQQLIGQWTDNAKARRFKNLVQIEMEMKEYLANIGYAGEYRVIPERVSVPLLASASLEEDRELQKMWGRLLANFANKETEFEPSTLFVDVLKSINPLEAKILSSIYAHPFSEIQHHGVLTKGLPEVARSVKEVEGSMVDAEKKDLRGFKPSKNMTVALSNLVRLNCLNWGHAISGGELLYVVKPTELGRSFTEACGSTPPIDVN